LGTNGCGEEVLEERKIKVVVLEEEDAVSGTLAELREEEEAACFLDVYRS
jgi:hypothetical protein